MPAAVPSQVKFHIPRCRYRIGARPGLTASMNAKTQVPAWLAICRGTRSVYSAADAAGPGARTLPSRGDRRRAVSFEQRRIRKSVERRGARVPAETRGAVRPDAGPDLRHVLRVARGERAL